MAVGDSGSSSLPAAPSPASVSGMSSRSTSTWPRATILVAGLISALLTGAAGESVADHFRVAQVKNPLAQAADMKAYDRAEVGNAVLAFGLQGAILGLLFGAVGGLSRRSARAGTIAGLAGLVIGGVIGAAASFGLFQAFFRFHDIYSDSLVLSLLAHAGVWGSIGACAGLFCGIGRGEKAKIGPAILGGLIGGAIGTALFLIAGTIFFPLDKTDSPVAVGMVSRLFAHGSIDLLVAVGVALVPGLTGPKRGRVA